MAKFIISAFADEASSSFDGQITALKENELTLLEPRSIEGKNILTYSEEEISEFAKALKKNGIKVGSLGSPIGKYGIDEDFAPHLELFKKALRVCEIFETKKMRMFSFFIPEGKHNEYRDEVIARLTVMTSLAAEKGITLCHENEAKIYGEMPRDVAYLLSAVPDLYAVFDPANYRLADADVMEGIDVSLKSFGYIHIKDAIFDSQTIVPAGEGEGKIGEILDIVNEKIDGEVILTVEPHLHVFDAYSGIDPRELKGKYSFPTERAAFDFAINALKNLLNDRGYRKDNENRWIK